MKTITKLNLKNEDFKKCVNDIISDFNKYIELHHKIPKNKLISDDYSMFIIFVTFLRKIIDYSVNFVIDKSLNIPKHLLVQTEFETTLLNKIVDKIEIEHLVTKLINTIPIEKVSSEIIISKDSDTRYSFILELSVYEYRFNLNLNINLDPLHYEFESKYNVVNFKRNYVNIQGDISVYNTKIKKVIYEAEISSEKTSIDLNYYTLPMLLLSTLESINTSFLLFLNEIKYLKRPELIVKLIENIFPRYSTSVNIVVNESKKGIEVDNPFKFIQNYKINLSKVLPKSDKELKLLKEEINVNFDTKNSQIITTYQLKYENNVVLDYKIYFKNVELSFLEIFEMTPSQIAQQFKNMFPVFEISVGNLNRIIVPINNFKLIGFIDSLNKKLFIENDKPLTSNMVEIIIKRLVFDCFIDYLVISNELLSKDIIIELINLKQPNIKFDNRLDIRNIVVKNNKIILPYSTHFYIIEKQNRKIRVSCKIKENNKKILEFNVRF